METDSMVYSRPMGNMSPYTINPFGTLVEEYKKG
jgi:hypothetical protein